MPENLRVFDIPVITGIKKIESNLKAKKDIQEIKVSYDILNAGFIIAIMAIGMGISNPSLLSIVSIKTDKENQGLILTFLWILM